MFEFISVNLSIILCFLFGIGLLMVEAFMPGFGLAGLSGIALEVISIVLVYQNYGGLAALGMTLVILAVIAIAIAIALRSIRRGRLSKTSLILKDQETVSEGYSAFSDMEAFLGKEGKTTTTLRPTGMAEFDGMKLNVVADGEYIPQDTLVRVDHVEGSRIVVRRVTEA